MSHHGKGDGPIPEEMQRAMIEKLEEKLGATNTFPEGKLTEDDEGGIQFAVGVKDGQVCLDFGKPIAWIGMNPDEADEDEQPKED